MKTFLLLVAVIQLVRVAVGQVDEEQYDLDALVGEASRRSEFFKEHNLELVDQNTNFILKEMDQHITRKTNDINELLQNNSNLVLLNQDIVKNAEDLHKNQTSMNESLSYLMEDVSTLKERNSKLADLNTNLTRARLLTQEESLAISIKIKEMDQTIEQRTNEVIEVQKNNSNLVHINQNIAENAQDLQKKLTTMNFSLSNLMEDYAILKKRNSELSMQAAREEKPALLLKIKEMDQIVKHKTNEIIELQQNNSNLILSIQNTAKNAEELQRKETSMDFSISNLINEIEKLKE
ncbi:hypothetical protein B566_EDAN010042, partial [Ephemera danica]